MILILNKKLQFARIEVFIRAAPHNCVCGSQRIFCTSSAVPKKGNTYSIPTQYFNTLRSYLINERNIPKTANALIIHRTTLTYRLQKISEIFSLNLEDPYQRLYLLVSFFILDTEGYNG